MTLGVVTDVSAPVATYDAVHAAMSERAGTAVCRGPLRAREERGPSFS